MMAMMMTMYVGYFSLANHLPKSIEKNSPFAAEQTARVQFNSPGFKWAAAQLHNGTEILKCMACFSNFYAISGGFDGEVLRFAVPWAKTSASAKAPFWTRCIATSPCWCPARPHSADSTNFRKLNMSYCNNNIEKKYIDFIVYNNIYIYRLD